MAPRQNRFSTPFTPMRSPSQSLRRLRTAFSPSRNPSNPNARSASPDSTSSTSSSSMSPLTYSSMSPRTASPADSHRSTASSIRDILRLRRQPSVLEVELEEERHLFGSEVDTCLEPRLSFGERNRGVEVGIFEVLDGRV